MNAIAPYAKSLVAALVAALGVLFAALDNDHVTSQEWVNVAIAFLVGLGVVFAVPNKDPRAEHQSESVQPPSE